LLKNKYIVLIHKLSGNNHSVNWELCLLIAWNQSGIYERV